MGALNGDQRGPYLIAPQRVSVCKSIRHLVQSPGVRPFHGRLPLLL